MQVFKEASLIDSYITEQKSKGASIGFVPTMGALHQGHLSLVKTSVMENDITAVSIFVNPTQFNNSKDLKRYPRIPEQDLQLLRSVDCDLVFLPDVAEIYPEKIESKPIELNGLDRYMEGEFRPGHFQGVATVVKRFFDIIHPTRAYFGEKDYQQLLIIKYMAMLFDLPVEIRAHHIERDKRGLALSSRNSLLTEEEREQAAAIFRTLAWARKNYINFTPEELKEAVEVLLQNEPLLLEYVEISNADNLSPLDDWNDAKHARIFIAAFMGKVRLIDNLSLF